VPSQRTLAGGILRECADKYNVAAKLFNSKLSSAVDSLNRNLPNSKMVYIDVYTPLLDLIQNPTKYGKTPLYLISFKTLQNMEKYRNFFSLSINVFIFS